MATCPRCGVEHPPGVTRCGAPEIGSPPDPLIGSNLVGKYEIRGLVGIGGMGRVYVAFDTHLHRLVAIKVLARHLAQDSIFIRRFKREARASAATGHPNIVQVLDFGTSSDGRPFMVMELLEGRDLSQELKQLGRLPISRSIDVVGQMLFGLVAAHEAGIIHRDLKPGNVFLAERRVATWNQVRRAGGHHDGDFVKLLDFGLSRFLTSEKSNTDLTGKGMTLGTTYYMAPEQIRNQGKVDGRADLYAVGVILFLCLTGRRPYDGDNPFTILHQILTNPIPDACALNPEIPFQLRDVVEKALAKESADRFQTAEEFIGALLPFLELNEPPASSYDDEGTTVEFQRPDGEPSQTREELDLELLSPNLGENDAVEALLSSPDSSTPLALTPRQLFSIEDEDSYPPTVVDRQSPLAKPEFLSQARAGNEEEPDTKKNTLPEFKAPSNSAPRSDTIRDTELNPEIARLFETQKKQPNIASQKESYSLKNTSSRKSLWILFTVLFTLLSLFGIIFLLLTNN